MVLKNKIFFFCLLLNSFFLFTIKVYSETNNKIKIIEYLNSLNNFSASFLQNDGKTLSEGKVYIGEKRVRAEYFLPVKILIILDHDKAMYYNYELDEDEFFNPKNTNAWFFYDIFRNPLFFNDADIKVKNNHLILEKNGLDIEEGEYFIKIYFENNPLVLRKIDVEINKEILTLSIYDHNYNNNFNYAFFKLINPKLLNSD